MDVHEEVTSTSTTTISHEFRPVFRFVSFRPREFDRAVARCIRRRIRSSATCSRPRGCRAAGRSDMDSGSLDTAEASPTRFPEMEEVPLVMINSFFLFFIKFSNPSFLFKILQNSNFFDD